MPETVFWNRALQSLPEAQRPRYASHFAHAERMERLLDWVLRLFR